MEVTEPLAESLSRLGALVRTLPPSEVRGQVDAEVSEVGALVSGLVTAYRLLKSENEYLARLSRRDEATGLYNHRHFMERLDEEYRRALRYRTALSVLIGDIDDFKAINDARGHLVGNEVLRRVARTISQIVRETDTPARYGGDEFALILPQTAQSAALKLGERLRAAVAALPEGISISVGVGSLERRIGGPIELLAEADRALYQAKALGKNRVMKGSSLLWTTGKSSAV